MNNLACNSSKERTHEVMGESRMLNAELVDADRMGSLLS